VEDRLFRIGVSAPVIALLQALAHGQESRAALDIELTQQDRAALDRAYPPPDRPRPLEVL
jgi:hypothetical protein